MLRLVPEPPGTVRLDNPSSWGPCHWQCPFIFICCFPGGQLPAPGFTQEKGMAWKVFSLWANHGWGQDESFGFFSSSFFFFFFFCFKIYIQTYHGVYSHSLGFSFFLIFSPAVVFLFLPSVAPPPPQPHSCLPPPPPPPPPPPTPVFVCGNVENGIHLKLFAN